MYVSEIFSSIQGESTYAGLPCIFIRLAGCNLACSWCDTPFARTREHAKELKIQAILDEIQAYPCRLVEITGGEPLIDADTSVLAKRLLDSGYTVLIETNGSVSLAGLDPRIIKIIDVKCPSSGHGGAFLLENLRHIGPSDEVKFVIGGRADYDYARGFIEERLKDMAGSVLFAPVKSTLEAATLAEWILKDGLTVRLQLQLHTYIWGDIRGR